MPLTLAPILVVIACDLQRQLQKHVLDGFQNNLGHALRLGGQLRIIPGAVIGWDMGAALALAAALGIEPMAAAELLPEIEAVMVRKLNEAVAKYADRGRDSIRR